MDQDPLPVGSDPLPVENDLLPVGQALLLGVEKGFLFGSSGDTFDLPVPRKVEGLRNII